MKDELATEVQLHHMCIFILVYVTYCMYTCCVQIESLHALLEQERAKNKILKLEVTKLQVLSVNMQEELVLYCFPFYFIVGNK